jgi:hypothetical protein
MDLGKERNQAGCTREIHLKNNKIWSLLRSSVTRKSPRRKMNLVEANFEGCDV